ncbi:MAG TPA: CAP domain-containing protein [Acidimicrobiales bacterium]|nr:CAP domain-containing protein [Acidimicrobiales bacterium]
MPPQPLVERALAAAIVVLLTVAGVVALAGGRGGELALGVERAAAAAPAVPAVPVDEVPRRSTRGGAARADVLASTVTAPTPAPDVAPTTTVLASAPVVTAAPTTQPAPTTTPAPAPTSPPATSAPPPATSPPATTAATTPAGTTRDGACESSMLGWMNEARSQVGRAPLAEDEAIQHVSLDWSSHMASTGELAHNPRFSDQIFAVRAEATTAGEVVGWSSESARAVFDEFMRSSLHRDTIRQPAFRHATVGCVRDAGGRLWVTADFWG